MRFFAAPLGGGGVRAFVLWLLVVSIWSRRLFFSYLSHTRSDFVDDGLGLSCCFRGNVMSYHISVDGFSAGSISRFFFCTIFGRFVVDLPVDRFLCLVLAVRIYLDPTVSVSRVPYLSDM